MSNRRHTSSPPAPSSVLSPERDGDVRCFTSRGELLAWHTSIHELPRKLRVLEPKHVGDVSQNLAGLAVEPHGGTLWMPTPSGSQALRWLDEARMEHAKDALSGPFPVRVEGQSGVLIGVEPNAAPTSWEELEPDGWPVQGAADARLDDRRVAKVLRAGPFAAPVNLSEADHRHQSLLDAGAIRWFRGEVVPTVAGLVALGDQPEKHLPGCAVAIRRPGQSDQLYRGSLPWLAERVAGERRLWGQVPSDVARALVVLALAERAWVGPDAATPITLTIEGGRVRLAVPTAAANAREREDRAPGNPHLRHLLLRCGELPAPPGVDLVDNDAVLHQLEGRYPGGRCLFRSEGTWLTIPLVPEERKARSPVAAEPRVAVSQPSMGPVTPTAPAPEAPATIAAPPALDSVAGSPPSGSAHAAEPPEPQRTRARRPRPPPVFHPRPPASPTPAPEVASASPDPVAPPVPLILPPSAPVVALPTPAPAPAPPTPPPPPAGPLSLDERMAQLRELFRQADRPLGMREIATSFGLHRDTLRGAIGALVAEGWLEPTDPNPRSPVLRYRRLGR